MHRLQISPVHPLRKKAQNRFDFLLGIYWHDADDRVQIADVAFDLLADAALDAIQCDAGGDDLLLGDVGFLRELVDVLD